MSEQRCGLLSAGYFPAAGQGAGFLSVAQNEDGLMGFLTPLFLLGLLAAAIPVAIHLIRRENPPKVMLGTLRFMKQTTKKLILFQQIQQWLLLLLRAALICLLVLAFARPLFYQGSMARLIDAEPKAVAILLDTSLSMRAGERFERAKEEALDILGGMN